MCIIWYWSGLYCMCCIYITHVRDSFYHTPLCSGVCFYSTQNCALYTSPFWGSSTMRIHLHLGWLYSNCIHMLPCDKGYYFTLLMRYAETENTPKYSWWFMIKCGILLLSGIFIPYGLFPICVWRFLFRLYRHQIPIILLHSSAYSWRLY